MLGLVPRAAASCAAPSRSCPTRGSTGWRSAYDEDARWLVVHRGPLRVVCNLADETRVVPLDRPLESVLLASCDTGSVQPGAAVELPAESVAVVRVAGSEA